MALRCQCDHLLRVFGYHSAIQRQRCQRRNVSNRNLASRTRHEHFHRHIYARSRRSHSFLRWRHLALDLGQSADWHLHMDTQRDLDCDRLHRRGRDLLYRGIVDPSNFHDGQHANKLAAGCLPNGKRFRFISHQRGQPKLDHDR